MTNIKYVAGTVDCVYPRPVEADAIHALLDYFDEKGHAEYADIRVVNAFDKDGEYIHAKFGQFSERDGGFMNDTSFKGHYTFRVVRRYSRSDWLMHLEADSLGELIIKMREAGVAGTLYVNFYNNIRKWGSQLEASFSCIIDAA